MDAPKGSGLLAPGLTPARGCITTNQPGSVLRTEGGRKTFKNHLWYRFAFKAQPQGCLFTMSSSSRENKSQEPAHHSIFFLTQPNEKDRNWGCQLPVTLPLALNSSWSCEAHTRTTALMSVLGPLSPVFPAMPRIQDPPFLKSPTHGSSPWQPSTTMGSTDSGKELGFTPKHSLRARRGLWPLRTSLSIKCLPHPGNIPMESLLIRGEVRRGSEESQGRGSV